MSEAIYTVIALCVTGVVMYVALSGAVGYYAAKFLDWLWRSR